MQVIPDTLDFSAYMRQTDCAVKVRPARMFGDELLDKFKPRDEMPQHGFMGSTKMRDKIQFRPGEITAWAGYNGHRKSMFTGQVALDLCACNERVLMASFEMSPADTLARMARQCFGVYRPATDSLRRFAEWTDERLWIFDHLGRIDPQTCLAVIRYFAEELQGTQILIDSLMMVCASEESMDEQKQFVTDMVRAAQEYGVHIHLIAHCRKPSTDGETKPPSKYDLRGTAAISDQAHNVITVWANKAKKQKLDEAPGDPVARMEPDARIGIEKQRNGSFEGALKLWFDAESLRFLDTAQDRPEPYRLEF